MTDEDIDRYAPSGELIPLLCAVAELTGDRTLLDDRFRPRLAAEMIALPEHGGVRKEDAAEAFEQARRAWQRHVHGGGLPKGPSLSVREIIEFMTDGADEYADLMAHEFGDAELGPSTDWSPGESSARPDFLVGIIGAGQAGLAMARELRRDGIDFVVFESADRVGGTWRWNTYPGCRLDTSTLAYSYSFFQRHDWQHYYAIRGTLEEYFRDFAAREQLLPDIRFNSRVRRATWDEESASWELLIEDTGTDRTSTMSVGAVVSAVGILNRPNAPQFEGLEAFEGDVVHSAEWTSDIDVRGKRVAIIGTGASAYQIAPAIVDEVSSLTIFQRNAPWMLPAPNYEDEVDEGRRWLMDNLPNYHRWMRLWEFWHSTIGKFALTKADPEWDTPGSVSEPNKRFRDALVARIETQYPGREDLIPVVTPTYPVGAKRMLRDNGQWARTITLPKTELVTEEIAAFDKAGIRTVDGAHHAADLTVLATGFHGTEFLATLDVIGRDGVRLQEFWGDESRAYNGVAVPGFPNLFCVSGPNTALVAIGSQTFMAECGIHYISQCLRLLLTEGATSIEPTRDAYRTYIDWVEQGNRGMAWAASAQQSWYRNSRGTNTVVWPYPLLTYYDITRAVDTSDVVLGFGPLAVDHKSGDLAETRGG